MKTERIDKKIIKVIVELDDYNLDEYYDNLLFLESRSILTLGSTNYRVFENSLPDMEA